MCWVATSPFTRCYMLFAWSPLCTSWSDENVLDLLRLGACGMRAPPPEGGGARPKQKQKKHRANFALCRRCLRTLCYGVRVLQSRRTEMCRQDFKKKGREVSTCPVDSVFDSVFYLLMPRGASLMNACTFGALACYLCLP